MKKKPSIQQINTLLELYKEKKFKDVEKVALNFNQEFPNHPFGFKILGLTLKHSGKLSESLIVNKKVLEITPKDHESHTNLGNTLCELGKLDEAETSHKKAISLKPDYAEAYYNLSITYEKLNRLDDAKIHLMQAIKLKSNFIEAYNNLGMVLLKTRNLNDAIKILNQALKINPNYYGVYTNLGNVLKELGELNKSISYHQKAISLNPDKAESYTNLGNVLNELNKFKEAEVCYKKAISLKSNLADTYYNLAITCEELKKFNEAINYCQKALDIDFQFIDAEILLYDLLKNISDFNVENKLFDKLKLINLNENTISPFVTLSWVDNSEIQYHVSKTWVSKKLELAKDKKRITEQKNQFKDNYNLVKTNTAKKIKVGFFGADFHEHAVMYLMAGLFSNYSKKEFEIYVFSYGHKKFGEYREKIKKNIDYFHDIAELSNEDIVTLVHKYNIEISIDLMTHTRYSRSNIFQYRLSPIQINYLGYPGTSGANFIDYIIADPIIIPKEQQKFYSEKIIYLPHTYQPNDNKRIIKKMNTKRINLNLPEKSFVFCCFNQSYKISKKEFDIWMRIMNTVNNSVLWLLKSNMWAEQNLLEEAEKNGINSNRIIFAEKVSVSEHLARHKYADLFIDTFNYNAHTSASDALWAGLPVVTKIGNQFSARVAASLLTAIDMPELITKTDEDYEKLILKLANNPKTLQELKNKLFNNKLKTPLFDTKRYVANFERGLKQAYKLYCNGSKPKNIIVEDKFTSDLF